MKVTTLKKSIVITAACIGIGLAPGARADHATNFLDALQTDVQTRLDSGDTNSSPGERRSLSAAARALNRNTKTLSADLGALAQASTALNANFSEDAAFNLEEETALDAYSAEASAQLGALQGLVGGTNSLPRSINNLVTQAQGALDRGNDTSNSVPVRAKALAFALNKIRVATMQAHRMFKAPLSFNSGQTIALTGRNVQIQLNGNGSYTIGDPESPDESGTWSYERTGATTGTATLSGGETINLKFANDHSGTFTGESEAGNTHGRFTVSSE